MKKALAIAALLAAMFVAGNVQAQTTIYAGYAPETFVSGSTSTNYQGFFAGYTQNFDLAKGIGVAAGGQFRMNAKSESTTLLGVTSTTKNNQFLIDIPILFNYGIGINPDLKITPFVGPLMSLALAGNTKYTLGSNTTNIDWYGGGSHKRFNLYVVFGADVRFSQFNLFGGYRLGLRELNSSSNVIGMLDLNSSSDVLIKTNGFFVGIGYSL